MAEQCWYWRRSNKRGGLSNYGRADSGFNTQIIIRSHVCILRASDTTVVRIWGGTEAEGPILKTPSLFYHSRNSSLICSLKLEAALLLIIHFNM